MLCEQCQLQEATVHLTLVVWPSTEAVRHEFCASCYPSAEARRVRTYNSQPNNPLPADVEHISALEYIEASAKAARNGVDKPAFKHIQEELRRLPMTQQRLALEMLPLAWQSLERGEEPGLAAGFAGCSWGLIEPPRLSEYTMWLEKIILRCFELRSQLPSPSGEQGPFALTLSTMLIALGKTDRSRFKAVLATLKRRGGKANLDRRWKVIDQAEKSVLESDEREL